MPVFGYEAFNAEARLIKGVVEAESAREARRLLLNDGLRPCGLRDNQASVPKRTGAISDALSRFAAFRRRGAVLDAVENLITLLQSGMTLDAALAKRLASTLKGMHLAAFAIVMLARLANWTESA